MQISIFAVRRASSIAFDTRPVRRAR